jgi:hypothetical protein
MDMDPARDVPVAVGVRGGKMRLARVFLKFDDGRLFVALV